MLLTPGCGASLDEILIPTTGKSEVRFLTADEPFIPPFSSEFFTIAVAKRANRL